MSTVKNSNIAAAVASLTAIGRHEAPIPISIRMAKLRRLIEAHSADVEGVRGPTVTRLRGDEKELDDKHPKWGEFTEFFADLMSQSLDFDEKFTIYSRSSKDGEEEYSWHKSFKSKLGDIEPNVIYGLLDFVDVEEVDA